MAARRQACCSLRNAYTTELCADAGFDWLLVVDGDHAPNDLPR